MLLVHKLFRVFAEIKWCSPARLQRFLTRWSPVKVLPSQNKYRGFVADIMGKKKIILVFQMEICAGRKVREKVVVRVFKILPI